MYLNQSERNQILSKSSDWLAEAKVPEISERAAPDPILQEIILKAFANHIFANFEVHVIYIGSTGFEAPY